MMSVNFPSTYSPWTASTYGVPMARGSAPGLELTPPIPATLVNGTRVFYQQASEKQDATMDILLPIGPNTGGAVEILGEVLLNGSARTKQYLQACSAQGIEVSAGPSGDKFLLSVSVPRGKEGMMMQVATTLLSQPMVDPGQFRLIQANLLKEFAKMGSIPEVPLSEAINRQFYGARHPYARDRKQLMADIARLTPNHVLGLLRQAMDYPEQCQVVLISPQPLDEQARSLNTSIHQSGWFANPYRQPALPGVEPVPKKSGVVGPLLVINNNVPRAHITQRFRAPAVGDADYPAFLLLLQLLKGANGAFFKTLRTDMGLVYGTQQSYAGKKGLAAHYDVNLEVDYDKIIPALRGMQQVVEGMRTQPITESALHTAKRQYMLNLRAQMQTTSGLANVAMPYARNDLAPRHPDELMAAIQRVRTQDVARVAQKLFDPQQGFSVLGISAPANVLAPLMRR